MKFLNRINSDLAVVAASALVIMICSVLLYAEFTRKVEARGAKQIGTIIYKREVAQRKYASQVIWEDLEQNAPVYNNDTVRTAEMSEARINLNGTYISLDENSLILLSMAGGGININFSHGSISANRGSTATGESGKINITSSDTEVSIEKGDVKLSRTEKKELDVTVIEGKADIKTGTEKKTIEKDEKAVISRNSATQVFKLALKLLSPAPNSTIITAARAFPVTFSWEPAPGTVAVYLEIARDGKFTKGIIVRPAAKNSVAEMLPEGGYYWRIKGVDAGTRTADYSDVRKLAVIRDDPVRLVSPQNNETITYGLKPPIINFRWLENKLASEYTVEISKDPLFKTITQSASTQLRDISIDALEAGTYYWRVNTKNANLASYVGTSPSRQINIVKRVVINPPSLISPPDATKLSTAMFGKDKKFIFSWSADSQVSQYDLMISRDKDFGNIFFRVKNAENFYAFDKTLPPGTYYWRVGSLSDSGQGIFSRPNTLAVVSVENIRLNDPSVLGVSDAGKDDKIADVRFSWTRSNYQGSYRLELSGDKGFLNMRDVKTVADTDVTIPTLRAGVYYWRVKLLDSDRNQIAESETRPLYMSTNGAIVASVEDIEHLKIESETAEKEKSGTKKEVTDAGKQAELAKKEEELARKEEEESARKREELARKQQEELAKKKEEELTRKKQEELSRIKREESARKKQELLANKKQEELRRQQEQQKRGLIERFPGRRVKWRTNIASNVMSQPVSYNNIIFATTKNGFLVGLNQNGGQLWRVNLGTMARSTPAADKNAVYIVTVKGLLHAINSANGTIKWTKTIEGPLLFGSAPIVENDRIFVATSYGVVQAFSPEGEQVWRKDLEEGIFSPVTSNNGILYVGTDRSRIYAIDEHNGDIRWTFKTDSRIFSASPRVYRGILFAGCYSGTFYALEASSGNLVWKFMSKKPLISSPAFFGDIVYFGSEDGIFYALNIKDGTTLWEFNTRGAIVAGPNVSRNNVFIPSGNTIYSVDVESGVLNWKEGFASSINTPVTVAGDSVLVGLDNGEVVSLRSF